MVSVLEQLDPFKWRSVEFPTTSFHTSISHDLVEHKQWNVDGAQVEDTGVAPLKITASIPFLNGIVPGKRERWGILYPDAFRAFLVAFADRRTGILQHPELGDITCKPHTAEVTWQADKRDGCIVEATWIQTRIPGDTSGIADGQSPIGTAEIEALNLDASAVDLAAILRASGYEPPVFEATFEDMLNSISAIGDQFALQSQLYGGKLDQLKHNVGKVKDSAERAKSALTWPVVQSCNRIQANVDNIKKSIQALAGYNVAVYTVPKTTTLAGVLASLPTSNTIADLMKLNPGIVGQFAVQAGTDIRYYEPRISA